MAGIYIHIPFCKQACYYCNFHFSTSEKKREAMLIALTQELKLRKKELENTLVTTIYFGGGTPSILPINDIKLLLTTVYENYTIAVQPEITLEANPDDITKEKIKNLKEIGFNRLSIGVQSFFEDDLKLMNRAHNHNEAKKSLEIATNYFTNISIDLIYGIPGMSVKRWQKNIATALSFNIPHISSYALTVEPKTVFAKQIAKQQIKAPKDKEAQQHFEILIATLEQHQFIHYELSNFSLPGYFSENNSAYWLGKKYIGIGPSAHSYNGKNRSWNISNNNLYIKNITANKLPFTEEKLTLSDCYNEYIMTGLRTIWGVSLQKVAEKFGNKYYQYLIKEMQKGIDNNLLVVENNTLKITPKGKFLSDGIASDLFYLP